MDLNNIRMIDTHERFRLIEDLFCLIRDFVLQYLHCIELTTFNILDFSYLGESSGA
jgi:hypothetical protein